MNDQLVDEARMSVVEALQTLAEVRGAGQVVITNQASARLWPRLSQHPLDFNFNPSTMGGAIPLGVGLAVAQPQREVLVISGDGSLLMSLGCLVTAVGSGAKNLTVVLLENAVYEVTGGQQTPADGQGVDYAGLARASGFPTVTHFDELSAWQAQATHVLDAPGPRFICLEVGLTPREVFADQPTPIVDRLSQFREALQ